MSYNVFAESCPIIAEVLTDTTLLAKVTIQFSGEAVRAAAVTRHRDGLAFWPEESHEALTILRSGFTAAGWVLTGSLRDPETDELLSVTLAHPKSNMALRLAGATSEDA